MDDDVLDAVCVVGPVVLVPERYWCGEGVGLALVAWLFSQVWDGSFQIGGVEDGLNVGGKNVAGLVSSWSLGAWMRVLRVNMGVWSFCVGGIVFVLGSMGGGRYR